MNLTEMNLQNRYQQLQNFTKSLQRTYVNLWENAKEDIDALVRFSKTFRLFALTKLPLLLSVENQNTYPN